MDIEWLRDFMALAQSLSFSRAAEARNVTQPAFSRRVRALEDWVGTPLFDRTTRGTSLTPAGERFKADAPAIIRAVTTLRRETRDIGNANSAALIFAATHALSFTFFPRWLRQVELHMSTGPVQLLSDSMEACEELMREGRAQFLLCHRHPAAPTGLDDPHFRAIDVGRDTLVPLCAPDATGAPRWQLDMATAPIPVLDYSAESGLGRIIAATRLDDGASTLRTVFSARLAATLLGMAREGEGVAWLPQSLAAEDELGGALVRAGGANWDIEVGVWLYRPDSKLGPAAESCWDIAAALASAPGE